MKKNSFHEKLGVSQQDLADYLGISRTLLSLADKGTRTLPSKALTKLTLLEVNNKSVISKEIVGVIGSDVSKQRLISTKKLKAKADKNNFLAKKYKKQLGILHEQYQQCLAQFKLFHNSLLQLPAGRESASDKLWLEMQKAGLLKKIQYCDETAQALLQLRIDLLEYEAKEIRKLL